MSFENKQTESVTQQEPKRESTSSEFFATVTETPKLNIRKRPSMESEVLYMASKDESIKIQPLQNSEWVRVISGPTPGFCMKQYLTINQ